MMMSRKMAIAAIALTAAGVAPKPAQAQDTKDLIETVGAMILADRLGIDPNVVLMAKMASGNSVYDLAPALALGAFGNGDVGSLMAMQSMGLGYNQMAPMVGVPQPTYVVLQNTRSLNNNYVWADELGSRYGVPQDQLLALNRAGYTWREIANALVESQQTGQPVQEALYENRIFGTNFEPTPYGAVYVPPRTTVRYSSWLPAPRTDWRFASNTLMPGQVMWVNNGWRTVPVTTSWSRVRVVRQPLYVLERDGDLRLIRQPVFTSGAFRIARVAPRTIWFAPQRTVFVRPTTSRYAVHEDWSTGRRAQRFVEPNYGQIRSAEVHRRNEIRQREHRDDVREMREERIRDWDDRKVNEGPRGQRISNQDEHIKRPSRPAPRQERPIEHKRTSEHRVRRETQEHRGPKDVAKHHQVGPHQASKTRSQGHGGGAQHHQLRAQQSVGGGVNTHARGGVRAQRMSGGAQVHGGGKARQSGGGGGHRKGGH
jgi:hypothetical protein